jgi:hypothetical protein
MMADDVAELSDDRFPDVRADLVASLHADREGRSASLLMREWIASRRDGDGEQAPKWLNERLGQLDEQDARRRSELTEEAVERRLEEPDRRLADHERRLGAVEVVVVALRGSIAGLQKSMVAIKAGIAGILAKLHNNRGAGAKPTKRDEIVERLRAEIEAGKTTLAECHDNPSKWAKIYGYHHKTFKDAVVVLLKSETGYTD